MRNPFIAAAMAAAVLAAMTRKGAMMAFNLGYAKNLNAGDFRDHAHRTSHRTVAQDKREARKARNRGKNK